MTDNSYKKINYFQLILDFGFLAFLLYLSYYTIFYFSRTEYFISCAGPSLLRDFYNFNLIFHELSHLIFAPLGEFMHVLGGTLGEFIFPVLFLFYFVKERAWRGVSFSIWWMGFNLVTASIYMRDAVFLRLPLLMDGGHDWVYIFTRLGIIKYTIGISNMVLGSGIVFVLISLGIFIVPSLSKIFILRRDETKV